ncbi:phytanoyl-CoA dioxygenase family protein [Pseudomonas sp. NPDC089996]|uniref:HalD/BesD family halogenase n=1 Tax=Pseudomonas sp. NPDC089996 TaxID=3364474 RepID=UPI003819F759
MMESIVLADIVSRPYTDAGYIAALGEQFAEEGYVTLENFFSPKVVALINEETRALHEISNKRDFTMGGYETPRLLSVAGGQKILRNTVFIPTLYVHHQLKSVLSAITRTPLFTVKHQQECIVANNLDGQGHTHGWHLDDPMYALIAILEAPQAGRGGSVEYVAHWRALCAQLGLDPVHDTKAGLKHARLHGLVRSASLKSGDCYLLNAGENLHRVTPIADDSSRRRVINMAFDHRSDFVYGDTADILYAEEELTHVHAL